MNLLPRFRKTAARAGPSSDVTLGGASDLAPYRYWVEDKSAPLRFLLEPARLTMQGGFNYGGPRHPFVRALRHGRPALVEFYGAFQPRDLAGMYGLASRAPGAALEPWRMPWIGWNRPQPPSSEAGVPVAEGVSFYGPASDRKIDVELGRLTDLARRIQRAGYQPERYGDIAGFFLVRGEDFRFFVRGGKHRTAVLAWMHPQQAIPVTFKRDWPRIIDRGDHCNWPLVRSGEVSAALALEIFDRYFDAPPPE